MTALTIDSLISGQRYHVVIQAYYVEGDFTARFVGLVEEINPEEPTADGQIRVARWDNGVRLCAWGWTDDQDEGHGWYCTPVNEGEGTT